MVVQEVDKINFKANVIPNGLEKHIGVNINNKLLFVGSFQFLCSLLDSLVKSLSKDYFKYLSQESDTNVLDLVKRKIFYPYEYMNDFEELKEELPSKEKLYSSLEGKNICDTAYEQVLQVWNEIEIKTMKGYNELYLKCDVLLSVDVFEKL